MGALADCERIVGELIGQPANTTTTLALVLGGLFVVRNAPGRVWIGVGLVAAGIGSLLFHGPMPAGAEWAHDTTLAWLILLVGTDGTRFERLARLPGLATLGALFAVFPELSDPTAAILAIATVATLLGRDRSLATVGPLALLALSAGVGRLGATGGPWCNPKTLLQPHALWHVAAAVAVAWWAVAAPARVVS